MTVILIAIIAMALVVVWTLPLIFAIRGWDAWRAIPSDVYARERMSLFRLRPFVLWVAFGVASYLGSVCQWLHWQMAYEIVDGLSLGLLALLLTAHLIWSYRLLRSDESVDSNLRRFTRYVIGGASFGLFVLVAGLLSKYVAA